MLLCWGGGGGLPLPPCVSPYIPRISPDYHVYIPYVFPVCPLYLARISPAYSLSVPATGCPSRQLYKQLYRQLAYTEGLDARARIPPAFEEDYYRPPCFALAVMEGWPGAARCAPTIYAI